MFKYLILLLVASPAHGQWRTVTTQPYLIEARKLKEGVFEVKASGSFNASINGLGSALTNVTLFPKWMPRVVEAKSVTSNDVYMRVFSGFFFISDVDYINTVDTLWDENGFIQQWETSKLEYPVKQGVRRITSNKGEWSIYKQNSCKVSFTHTFTLDVGNVPDWVIDLGLKDGVIDLLKAVEKEGLKRNAC